MLERFSIFRIISLGETLVSEISGSKWEFFRAGRSLELYLGSGFSIFAQGDSPRLSPWLQNVEVSSQLLPTTGVFICYVP